MPVAVPFSLKHPLDLPSIVHSKDQTEMTLVKKELPDLRNGTTPSGIAKFLENQKSSKPLSAFYIDRTEITVEKYKVFDPSYDEKAYTNQQDCPTCPVMAVDWSDALRYCLWAEKQLPTEEEWAAAAQGPSKNVWPWGEKFEPHLANLAGNEDGFESVAKVNSFPAGATIYGVVDMVGNVWEWVDSRDDPSLGKEDGVLKGGGWRSKPEEAAISFRNIVPKNLKSPTFGFRCSKPMTPGK